MVCNTTDMSNVGMSDQKLLDKVVELEDKLDSSRINLERSSNDLKRLAEENSNFVSIIAHDFKTPLTGLKLFSELLLSDGGSISDNDRQQYLKIISSEADRLSRMISNVVEFHNMCSDSVHWHDEVVNVIDVIERCVRPFSVLCQSKGLDFSFETELESLSALLDKDRLSLVVYNLLSNALAFTHKGSIKLYLRSSTSGDGLFFSISDTGIGMSDEKQKSFFSKKTGVPLLGKGLGLYVSRYIISHYQGGISIESNVGKGTVLSVELPLKIV